MPLFNSQAEQAVRNSVLMAKWTADTDRREEAENRLSLYKDDYEEIIRAALKEQYHPDNYSRLYFHVNGSQNILKRVINDISMVYKVEATRTLTKGKLDRYDAIRKSALLDVKLKKVNRFSNLQNECLLKVAVRGGKIAFDIITPNICGVIQNDEDPTQADAIWYAVPALADTTSWVQPLEYYYYDVLGRAVILDDRFMVKEVLYTPADTPFRYKNGEFFIPLVTFHRTDPDDEFFDGDSGRDLYSASVAIGCKMTLFDYLFKTSSHKQIYIIGSEVTIPNNQVLDPTTAIQARHGKDGTASMGTLDIQANLLQLRDALTYQINSVVQNYGISPDAWTLSFGDISGRALKIRNQALLEQREDQLPMFRAYEDELFRKVRAINNNFAKAMKWDLIPEEGELEVDFGEIGFPEDPQVEFDMLKQKMQAGVISLANFYQAFNPDVANEKKAEQAIIDNLNKLAELRQANPNLDDALNAIMGGGKKAGAPEDEEDVDEEGNPIPPKKANPFEKKK